MAKITPKGKKVKGTKKKDKITWQNKKAWQKTLTVNAGAGNDIINFTKSKYKNVLNGEAGNDTIKGGKKNDKITGGKGNDTIYTGKGTNTVVINKGDGNDTIYHQGTKTVIKVKGAKSNDKQAFEKKGNDLLLTYTHGGTTVKEVLTFKNFFTGNKNIFLGNQKLENLINSKGITINGSGNIQGTNYNDIINGAIGDDFIIGGKGADIINAGAGRNTIVHDAGDGNDVIVSGGGNDKLSFGGVNSIDDITATFTDNDIIFTTPNGETVTLQNALINGHSVDTIEIGDDKYTTDRFKNSITSSDSAIYGTVWHDDIQITNPSYQPVVYAGAGDDIIHVTSDSKKPYIRVGAGDDTISLNGNDPSCYIYFENGDGNNTLTGLPNSTDFNFVFLKSKDLFHSIKLSDSFSYNYITNTKDGNNLILKLAGGETFTIENYYGISSDIRSHIYVEENGTTNILSQYLKSEDDIITVDAEPNEIYEIEESSNKLIIAPEADFRREIDILADSNNNDIVIKGQDEDLTVRSYNNNIYFGGGSHSVYMNEDGLTGNNIYFYGNDGYIRTSDGGSTFINASTDLYTTIISHGTDKLYLKKGDNQIFFNGNYDETVTIGKESKEVQIQGVEVAKSTTITQQSTGKTVTDIMFEHYSNWKDSYNNDYLSVKYFDKNGSIINGENNKELIFKGKWEDDVFNLDNATVGDKVTVGAGSGTKTLSQMSQYVDMTNSSLNKLFKFADKTQNGLLDNRAGVYIKGSDSQDYYTGYTFANGKVTINDAGGRGDINSNNDNSDFLRLDMARNSYRFFIDIDKNGNSAGNGDMFIFTHNTDTSSEEGWLYDGLWQHLNGNEDNINAYVKIEGQVDASEGGGVPDTWYLPNGQIEYINDNDKTGGGFNLSSYFFHINMDVAGWIASYNSAHGTYCNTVSQAIANGQATSTELTNLYNYYCDNTNWAGY